MTESPPVVHTFPDGRLAQCDCLDWFPHLPEQSVRLVVVDPPFFTGKRQTGSGPEAPSYEDSWAGGLEHYLDWLLARVDPMRNLLLADGSFVIHLDWHAVHAVKVALDRLFGASRFQNEIIWCYQTGGAGRRRFSRKHDSLLWYTKSDDWLFRPERIPVPRSPKALHRARNPKGARISAADDTKLPGDVMHIPALNPMANERTGYPTQKPVELIDVFVRALSDPGETVADFFCGSGTTLVAARRQGRRWLGCDVSAEAVRVVRGRLES